jgi:hypothetical protein
LYDLTRKTKTFWPQKTNSKFFTFENFCVSFYSLSLTCATISKRLNFSCFLLPSSSIIKTFFSLKNPNRARIEGTKHVDPDTGIIYFKYDFGYEFGIIFPGEGKKIVGGIRNGNHQSEKSRPIPQRASDIEMPVIHEKSNGRASVVSFGATTPIEFEKHERAKKRYSLPSPNYYDRLTPKSGTFQTSGTHTCFELLELLVCCLSKYFHAASLYVLPFLCDFYLTFCVVLCLSLTKL